MTGKIFNIQRFSTSDGPGLRTTVFMKGCPLSCAWCHNPESKTVKSEIFYNSKNCIGCQSCKSVCQFGQHVFENGIHTFLRNDCCVCMKCASVCSSKALEICGRELSVKEVTDEILRDVEFYEQSNGGVTLSGGEPLMQYEFSCEILKASKNMGINTAIETSGYCYKSLGEISKYVDHWLYDIKLFPESDHIKYTGVSNKIIFENLCFLDNMGKNIVLRCPIIPNVNLTRDHFDNIVKLENHLNNVSAIHIELYHPLGIDKAIRLGKEHEYKNNNFLSKDDVNHFVDYIRESVTSDIEII